MTRGRLGAIAGAAVIGLFLIAGVTQRVRTSHAVEERATDASRARVTSAVEAPSPAETPSTTTRTTPAPAVANKSRLVVAFQLDRKLTQGHYLGERWVSPPVFEFAQPGERYVVRARLQSVDPQGERTDLSGDWATGDPGMLAITRLSGGEVELEVAAPGHTELTVKAGGESKVLQVEARKTEDAMEVAFRQ